ncbi:ATP-binding protein [Actinoallomurus acanthiterrae]
MTSFIGRERELAEVKRLLGAGRLVTLTGVGGVGKTRLALSAATDARRAFPDGVWLVDLVASETPKSPVRMVAETLGLRNVEDPAGLARRLAGKRMLLVLDNCEHLIDECAVLVGDLLCQTTDVRILATSRQLLRANGEHVLEVPSLPVPESDAASADTVLRYAAVRLFGERASAVVPEFAVCDENAAAVTRLCHRLDGLPLAIEFAALRLRILSVEQIVDRLDQFFRLLRCDSPVVSPRQKSLRGLIDWSYDLCSAEERTLWARLSVFSGACDLETAEQVCDDGILADAVLEAAAGLVEKSILGREPDGSRTRYRLLTALRRYGQDRLVESGEEQAVRRRHREWYRDLAEQAGAEWFGPHQVEWLDRMAGEEAEWVAALESCLDEPGEERTALEMAAALGSHPLSFSSLGDGHRLLQRALAADPSPSTARARTLWADAWLCLRRGDLPAAAPLLEECRDLAERLDDQAQLAGVVHLTGLAAVLKEDFPRACALLRRALAYYRAAGDHGRAWTALLHLATAAVFMGDARATDLCRESEEMCESAGARWSRREAQWITGVDLWRRGDARAATGVIRQALRPPRVPSESLGLAYCVEALSWIAADQDQHEYAAELLGAADSLWRSAGAWLPALGPVARAHTDCETGLKRTLGQDAFAVAHARGARLTLEQAIARARDEEPTASKTAGRAETGVAAALTRREREIAELVARGFSNKDIASALVIAPRTAEGHVGRIMNKMGFTSRTQVAAVWAAQYGIG